MRKPLYLSGRRRALAGRAFFSLILIVIELQFRASAEERGLEPRLVPQFGQPQAPAEISYSPDGRYIVTAGGTLLLWDASSGDLLRRFGKSSSNFQCAKISPDGRRVVAGGSDGVTLVWDLASGKEMERFEGHEGSVAAVAWSLDGSSLATAGTDGTARVWNAVTKTETRRLMVAGQQPLTSVALSPDGRFLVAGGYKAAYLWDLKSGDLIHTLGHRFQVLSVAFSPDGKHLITGAKWDPLRLFETSSGTELRRYQGLEFAESINFSADGRHVAFVSDNTVRVLRPESGEIVRTFGRKWTDDLFSATLSPDGRLVACGATDGTRVYQLETGNEVLRLQGRAAAIMSVAISPDGRRILTAKDSGEADIWDGVAGRVTGRIEGDLALFSPDGRFIASGGHEDGTARLWDTYDREGGPTFRRIASTRSGAGSTPRFLVRRTFAADRQRYGHSAALGHRDRRRAGKVPGE